MDSVNNQTVRLTIDGRQLSVRAGASVLEAAREAGIYVPALCAHRDLAPVGACRICLVKVGGMRGFPPACTTEVAEGMEVTTADEEVQNLRREVLKLILLEHPSSCLICVDREPCESFRGASEKSGKVTGCMFCSSRGGCELADVVRYVGLTELDYPTKYKNQPLEREDPFYDRDYNLCILCGRCVRMCQEVRGARAIEFAGRGIQTVITPPYGGRHVDGACTFCGSCIDVCPTGTLAPRATKWFGQPEGVTSTVCPHCGLGCRLMLGQRRGRLVSVKPDWDSPPTHGYLCAKGRFGVVELVHNNRRRRIPLIRNEQGSLLEVSWEDATRFVADKLAPFKGAQFAAVLSADMSNEDAYLFSKFTRLVMRSNSVATDDPAFVAGAERRICERLGSISGNATIADVENARAVLIVGADPAATHPAMEVAVKRASDRGAAVIVANRWCSVTSRRAGHSLLLSPGGQLPFLSALARILIEEEGKGDSLPGFEAVKASLVAEPLASQVRRAGVSEEDIRSLARLLAQKRAIIVFGYHLMRDLQALDMLCNVAFLCALGSESGCRLMPLWQRSNAVGSARSGARPFLLPGETLVGRAEERRLVASAWQGEIPAENGSDLGEIVEGIRKGEIKALYLAGGFPEPGLLERLECLILQSPFSDSLEGYAAAVLPSTLFAESAGTVTNIEGRVQEVHRVVKGPAMSRPDWETVAHLARVMGAGGFEYPDWKAVADELAGVCGRAKREVKRELVPCRALSETEAGDEFPFVLLPGLGDLRCRNSSLAVLVRGFSDVYPSKVILMARDDLKRLSVHPGDKVRIKGAGGGFEAVVDASADVPPGRLIVVDAGDNDCVLGDTTGVPVNVEKLTHPPGGNRA